MSVYGDLSKAQRILLAALYGRILKERAVSIATGHYVQGKQLQTVRNLKALGLVECNMRDRWDWQGRVWLTALGVDEMGRVGRERRTSRYANRHYG